MSQSNDNANFVDPEERFKFVDDLTIIEIVNLMSIGIACYNVKQSVPNDIPVHNGYIPPEHLKTQTYIDKISEWTDEKLMMLNKSKSNIMIFNYTKNNQFTTRINLDGEILKVLDSTKLLGTYINNDLKWDKNTNYLV